MQLQRIDNNQQIAFEYSASIVGKTIVIHILLVDDEPCSLEISKRILLTKDNFVIETASCVEEAFKKIKTQTYDVIISDYEMPQKNGLQFLEELRLQKKEIPFILFTGKGRDEISIKALNLGVDGYIEKHGDPETIYEELKHKIIQLTNQYRIKKEHTLLVDQYKQFFSNVPSAVVIYEVIGDGEDFIFKDFNFAAERIERISKANVIGKRVTDVFPGVKDFGLFEVLKRVWKTGKAEYFPDKCYRDVRDTGTWRENWVIKLANGNLTAIYNDITERKRIEEALIDNQKKFSALFESNPDASVFYDNDFRVIEANSRFCLLFGYSLDEIKGKDLIDLIVPEDAKPESEAVRQRIKSGLIEIVTTRRRKDGEEIPLLVSGNPVFSGRKVIGTIFVFKEISEIITVQEELSKALSKTQELNEKLKVVGNLTRHDVRNKLTTITGYSYILKKKYADKSDIIDCLGKMEQSVKDSMKIFDFAKAYEQIGVEELAEVDVERAINEAVGMFSNLSFKVVNDCHGLIVHADSLLTQLIYNLIDNTRKYGKKATLVRIYYQKTAEGITLTFEDNGVGIPSENKEQLFRQGFSTGNSTGFGLFLSKKMLDVYGWTFAEIGEPGKGAKFVMQIPSKKLGAY